MERTEIEEKITEGKKNLVGYINCLKEETREEIYQQIVFGTMRYNYRILRSTSESSPEDFEELGGNELIKEYEFAMERFEKYAVSDEGLENRRRLIEKWNLQKKIDAIEEKHRKRKERERIKFVLGAYD